MKQTLLSLAPNQVLVSTPGIEPPTFAHPQRVLWVVTAADALVMIGIEPIPRQPRTYRYSAILEAINSGQLEITEIRPRPFTLKSLDAIPSRYVEMRDRAWDVIAP
jgi:hypothetical protein